MKNCEHCGIEFDLEMSIYCDGCVKRVMACLLDPEQKIAGGYKVYPPLGKLEIERARRRHVERWRE